MNTNFDSLLRLDVKSGNLYRINPITGEEVPYTAPWKKGRMPTVIDVAHLAVNSDVLISCAVGDFVVEKSSSISENAASVARGMMGVYLNGENRKVLAVKAKFDKSADRTIA